MLFQLSPPIFATVTFNVWLAGSSLGSWGTAFRAIQPLTPPDPLSPDDWGEGEEEFSCSCPAFFNSRLSISLSILVLKPPVAVVKAKCHTIVDLSD